MKILVDIRLLARGGTSGIEEYTRSLLDHLFAIDRENEYLLFYNGLVKQALPAAWREYEHVSVINWRIPNRLLDASMRFAKRPVIDTRFFPHLIWSPHFNFLRVAHAPRVITFHDLSFIHHPDFFSSRQRFWHSLQHIRRQAEEAAHLIAVSEFTKRDLMENFAIPEDRISVIHSGINPGLIPLRANDLDLRSFRKAHDLTHPFLLYLGTLEPRKNIPAIIRAFNLLKDDRRFRDLRLIVAGRPGWLYRSILREAESSPHHEDIHFWGRVEERDKLYLYNLARAFAYPSFFEGFGFPPLEAQACGTPVVVADRTSLPEIVGESALRVNPWQPEALAGALAAVIPEGAARRALIRAGYDNAARFTWRLAARKTLAVFNQSVP